MCCGLNVLSRVAVCFGLSSPLCFFSLRLPPSPSPSFSFQPCVMWYVMIETTSTQSQLEPSPLPPPSVKFYVSFWSLMCLLPPLYVIHTVYMERLEIYLATAHCVQTLSGGHLCFLCVVNPRYPQDLIKTHSSQRKVWCMCERETNPIA